MRDIEGVEAIVAHLRPHWGAIDDHFNRENEAFIRLFGTSHDAIGPILRCHLVLEHYVDRFLTNLLPTLPEVRLSFAQKAKLLPIERSAAAFVRPGVIHLNAIRNRLAHNLGAQVDLNGLGPILPILEIARPGVVFDSPVAAIEAFTTVACTFLIVPPPELREVFATAFTAVRVRDNSEDAA